MSQIPFDVVGFDLDGTLVDSAQDLANAVNHALGEMGLPPHGLDSIKRFVGNGVRVLVERALRADNALSDAAMQTAMPLFTDYYAANLCVHTLPYPGAVAALEALRARGVRLAVCTNKAERFTLPLLDRLGLLPLLDAVVGGDTLGPGILKPDPAPILAMIARAGGGRGVFLGDTSNDIDAARAAGIASIAVRFGFIDEADRLGADATLAHFDGLVGLLSHWPG